MSWVKSGGHILKQDGKIAISTECCCDCGCQPPPSDNLIATFRANGGASSDCFLWEGLTVPMTLIGPNEWRSDPLGVAEWAGIEGWLDTILILRCIAGNGINPSDPEQPCKDYVFSFVNSCHGLGEEEESPLTSCSCDPFSLTTGIIFQLIGGGCCQLCSCDIFADASFYWDITEAP